MSLLKIQGQLSLSENTCIVCVQTAEGRSQLLRSTIVLLLFKGLRNIEEGGIVKRKNGKRFLLLTFKILFCSIDVNLIKLQEIVKDTEALFRDKPSSYCDFETLLGVTFNVTLMGGF